MIGLDKSLQSFFVTIKKFILYAIIICLSVLPTATLAFSAYSTEELEELEKEFIELINQSSAVERNPLASQYINHIGKKLARYANIPTPYFFIVNSLEINAFAGPGGFIGVNTQLILASDNESELAAVMAHEIAHVRLHHLYYLIQHQKQMRIPMLASILASLALGVINPTLGSGAMMASLTGFAQDNINFVRSNEKAADRIGINMLIKAGFDPRGMAGFFKKMQENMRYYYTANIPAILRTHPLDEDRIAEAENKSSRIAKKNYPDNLDYHLFKELIRVTVSTDNKKLLEYYQNSCSKRTASNICQYGYSLALLQNNNYKQAKEHLALLTQHYPDNLYYQVAMAQSEAGLKEYQSALVRLQELYNNYPDNYAAMMAYAQGLLDANETQKAVALLLKGSRIYKRDLPLCKGLARAQSKAGLKSYAYFTQAQCLVLEGRHREALRQLKVAQNLAKNDAYLQARISATIDDITFEIKS